MASVQSGLPPGAVLIPEFVSSMREAELLNWLDHQDWRSDLRRRVQHYGWVYDYRARKVSADSYIGPLPVELTTEGRRMCEAGLFDEAPDQIIVNEYETGQGIAPHVDCVPCFGPIIASLSLGSQCEVLFVDKESGARIPLILEPRCLLVLTKAARFDWSHAIPARKSDLIEGRRVQRSRRVSLTYRTVLSAEGSRM